MIEADISEIPTLPDDYQLSPLDVASAAIPTSDPNVYSTDLKPDWRIGMVPHGGYLCAMLASAAQTHMSLHHPDLEQTDIVTIHQEFISACVVGQAEVIITELSRGRQFSTLRVQLYQSSIPDAIAGSTVKRILRIEALVRQASLSRESLNGGISMPTIAPTDSSKYGPLPDRNDWLEWKDTPAMFARRTAYAQVIMLVSPGTTSDELRVDPKFGPSVREQWITWRDPEQRETGFNIPALCYLADTFRPLPELYGLKGMWYPTMSMDVQVKTLPPAGCQGWKWLFMRVEVHQIKHGRLDFDVTILEEEGGLVALARHTALIVPAARNHKRGVNGKEQDGSAVKEARSKI